MVSLSLSGSSSSQASWTYHQAYKSQYQKAILPPLYVFEMLLQVRVGKIEFLMMMQHQHHHLMSSFIPGFV